MNMTDDTKQPEDIATMTPERAGELLTQMTKEFNAAEAARRAGLQPAEPPRPTDADGKPIPTPEGQIFLAPEERERRQMAETLDYLEANGAPMRDSAVGKDIWAYFDGRQPVTPEIQADVEKRLAAFMRDEEWVKRFNAKEERATRQFHTATTIIAAGKIQRPQD
jgi:hypothetical protein